MTQAEYADLFQQISQPMRDHAFACWKCGWGDPEVLLNDQYTRWANAFRKCKVGYEVWGRYIRQLSKLNKLFWGRFCCRCSEHAPCSHERAYSCTLERKYIEEALGLRPAGPTPGAPTSARSSRAPIPPGPGAGAVPPRRPA